MSSDFAVSLLIIICLMGWGAWGVFDKKALAVAQPAGQLVAVFCFCPLLVIMMIPAMNLLTPGWQITSHTWMWAGAGALTNFVATIAYLIALSKKDASLVVGAMASYPVLAQILAFVMLGEPLVLTRLIGCLVVVAGMVAISHSGKERATTGSKPDEIDIADEPIGSFDRQRDAMAGSFESISCSTRSVETVTLVRADAATVKPASGTIYGGAAIAAIGTAIATCGWAFRGICDKVAVTAASPFEVYLAKSLFDCVLCMAALTWILSRYRASEIGLSKPALWPLACGSALSAAAGSAAYYVALSMSSASYVIAITGCYPLVLYIMALAVLKERFSTSRLAGIGLITIGAIMTQTTQSL